MVALRWPYSPSIVHRQSIDSPSTVHRQSIGSPLAVHWQSIDSPLTVHCQSIDSPLTVHRQSIDSPSTVTGPCGDHVGTMSGPCRDHVGTMSGPCRDHVGTMCATSTHSSTHGSRGCSDQAPGRPPAGTRQAPSGGSQRSAPKGRSEAATLLSICYQTRLSLDTTLSRSWRDF